MRGKYLKITYKHFKVFMVSIDILLAKVYK